MRLSKYVGSIRASSDFDTMRKGLPQRRHVRDDGVEWARHIHIEHHKALTCV
jgi:hypothetical protein